MLYFSSKYCTMNCILRYFKSKRERKSRERCLKYALETIGDSKVCIYMHCAIMSIWPQIKSIIRPLVRKHYGNGELYPIGGYILIITFRRSSHPYDT